MLSVGDMKNNLRVLKSEARQMKCSEDFDLDGVTKGNPQSLLPLYNYIFTTYNPQFSEEVMTLLDDGLYMKSDVRFMESIYKVLRDMFHYKPPLTKEQFFTINNFAERKVIMCVEVMRLVHERCRLMGRKNPTNNNIKVSSVIDTGRQQAKRPHHKLVTSEPSSVSESHMLNRKIAPDSKACKPPSTSLGIGQKSDWQMKMGYLRPKSMGIPGEEHREDSNVQDAAKREGGKAGKAGAGLNGMAGPAAVQDVPSPLEGSTKSRGAWVEVVHMPSDKRPRERSHKRMEDMVPRSKDPADRDKISSDAVEAVLAKVRDLPSQLTSFMKAVEGRLQKIEERLDKVETGAAEAKPAETAQPVQENFKTEINTLLARLILLENRVMLVEKSPSVVSSDRPMAAPAGEGLKMDYMQSPFVSLERGEERLFGNLLQNPFSPIRQDGDLSLNHNSSIICVPGPEKRLSSTPNQSDIRTPVARPASEIGSDIPAVPSGADPVASDPILDTPTQQQVERIQELFKATQQLLPSSGGEVKADTGMA